MSQYKSKNGRRKAKGLEHLGPMDEKRAQFWEGLIARGLSRAGVPDIGIGGHLRKGGSAAAIATLGIHAALRKESKGEQGE